MPQSWLTLSGFLSFLIIFSCSENSKTTQADSNSEIDSVPNKIQATVNLENWRSGHLVEDNKQAWFIPENLKQDDSVVCILFFDPQGNGMKPIKLYQKIAEMHGCILIGSKISKNGMGLNETKNIADQLLKDISNYSGFKRLAFYTAGFSGGAKVALHAGNNFSAVKGVIYTGAAALDQSPLKSLYGFAGNMDMNMADLVQFDAALPATVPHFLKIWNGKHEWPSSDVFTSAFEWIKIRENGVSGGVEKRSTDLQFQARRTRNLLEKESLLLEASFLADDLGRKDLEIEDLEILQTRPAFIEIKKAVNQELENELAMKETYSIAFFDKDISWWRHEIADLKAHNKHKSSNLQDRLLGFFSLASYSLANKALQEQDENHAEKILEIYRLTEPENFEQAYLRAVLAARRKQNTLVTESLSEAVKLGFNDRTRISNQAEFKEFLENQAFKEILEIMKQGL